MTISFVAVIFDPVYLSVADFLYEIPDMIVEFVKVFFDDFLEIIVYDFS